jgi:Transposase DNA-binding/Transposase DDE domain
MELSDGAVERIAADFANAALGDPRRTRRAQVSVAQLAMKPSASLPEAMGCESALEGVYRFVNNRRVTFKGLLHAHSEATASRAAESGAVLVVHDTTDATFPELDAKEIGYLSTGKPGFLVHVSLVLDGSRWRRPLGVIDAETIHRSQRSKRGARKSSGRETVGQADSEGTRWWRGIEAAGRALQSCSEVVHVADRESDSYELMHKCLEGGHRFVFRTRVTTRRTRIVTDDAAWSTVASVARRAEGVLERDVLLSARKTKGAPGMNRGNPPRHKRTATLRFSATRVELRRPQYLQDPFSKTLPVNLVQVMETGVSEGETPVQWLLYTTEPIDTPEQVARIVDIYRARWTVEEFNAALKTGCAYEARQLESRHALLNLLALSLPVACELLALRSRARDSPDLLATDVLRPAQLEVLRALGRRKLSDRPTAREALLGVAALGGHLKRNGEPGWNVLMRGTRTMLDYELAWVAGKRAGYAEQSPDL